VPPLREGKIPSKARGTLAAGYPETDFDRYYLLTEYNEHEKVDAPVFAVVFGVGAAVGLLFGP